MTPCKTFFWCQLLGRIPHILVWTGNNILETKKQTKAAPIKNKQLLNTFLLFIFIFFKCLNMGVCFFVCLFVCFIYRDMISKESTWFIIQLHRHVTIWSSLEPAKGIKMLWGVLLFKLTVFSERKKKKIIKNTNKQSYKSTTMIMIGLLITKASYTVNYYYFCLLPYMFIKCCLTYLVVRFHLEHKSLF